MKILYIGQDSGTSKHRADALARLSHTVKLIDPFKFLPTSYIFNYVFSHFDQSAAGYLVSRGLQGLGYSPNQFDLGWVDQGTAINKGAIEFLRKVCGNVLHYTPDDPFSIKFNRRFKLMTSVLKFYDLCVFPRPQNVDESLALGCKNAVWFYRAADEVVHRAGLMSTEESMLYQADVVFVGTFMSGRDEFIDSLIEKSVPIKIFGNNWDKSRIFRRLRRYIFPAVEDFEYTKTIQGAKICLGLLNHDNRDESTSRSFEIPWAGGLLCAERTPEHLTLYREDDEAVFWSNVDECASICHTLLRDEERRNSIKANGHHRAISSGYGNETLCRHIIRTMGM